MQNDKSVSWLYSFALIHSASTKAIAGSFSEFVSASDNITFWRRNRNQQYLAFHVIEDERSLFISSVAYSRDGSFCMFSSVLEFEDEEDIKWVESRIRIYCVKNHIFRQIGCIADMNFVLCVCFLHNNDYIAYGCDDGSVNIFKKSIGENVVFERYQTLRNLQKGCLAIAFCEKTKLLVATSHDATAFVWRLGENMKFKSIKSLIKHSKSVCGVAFSHQSTTFATISYDGTFCVWSTDTLNCILFKQFKTVLRSVVAFPHDDAFVCGTRDGTLVFWHKDNIPIREISLTKRSIECVAFLKENNAEDMDLLVFGARDNKIRICKITQKPIEPALFSPL